AGRGVLEADTARECVRLVGEAPNRATRRKFVVGQCEKRGKEFGREATHAIAHRHSSIHLSRCTDLRIGSRSRAQGGVTTGLNGRISISVPKASPGCPWTSEITVSRSLASTVRTDRTTRS